MPHDKPTIFIHPKAPTARGRALYHARATRNLIESARRLRLGGEAEAARLALRDAAYTRKLARYEFRIAATKIAQI